jgi:uncharacterized membrane protein YwaF
MEAEQAARQFPLFYLYPRGDGGTAVPDVDVASGGELHVLAFDERAYPARGLSHHVVFRRRHPAERQYMGKCFLLLLAMAVPIYCVNLLLDTNFMFLMYAPDGNPLAWFRDHVGYHWIGFPVLLVAVFALMDVPIMLKKRKEDKLLSAVK